MARLDTDSDFTNFRSVLFGHGTTSTNRGLHLIFGPTVGIRYGHYNNDYDVGIKDNASYYTIWRHYVFVYDGSNHSRKVYIDGQEVTSTDNYSNVDYAGTVIKDGMERLMILLYGMFHYPIVRLLSFTKIHLGIHQK